MKDIAFRRKELQTWQAEFKKHTVQELPDCGHFLAEEAPDIVVEKIRAFVGKPEAMA